MKPIKTRPFISITGQDWSYVLHHYTRDREKLLQWRGEGYPIYTYNINMHLLCDWSEFLPKIVHLSKVSDPKFNLNIQHCYLDLSVECRYENWCWYCKRYVKHGTFCDMSRSRHKYFFTEKILVEVFIRCKIIN